MTEYNDPKDLPPVQKRLHEQQESAHRASREPGEQASAKRESAVGRALAWLRRRLGR